MSVYTKLIVSNAVSDFFTVSGDELTLVAGKKLVIGGGYLNIGGSVPTDQGWAYFDSGGNLNIGSLFGDGSAITNVAPYFPIHTYNNDTPALNTETLCINQGISDTWTLPDATAHAQEFIIIKNQGPGTITVASSSGSQIFDATAVASVLVLVGEAITLISDGTYWNIV